MKITLILSLVLMLITGNLFAQQKDSLQIFSQTDSVYKTEDIFYITYLDFNKEVQELKGVRLISFDSISLTYEDVILGKTSNENKYIEKKLVFDRIQKFGYRIGAGAGTILGRGALIGFGTGFVIGFIGGKLELGGHGSSRPTTFGDRFGTGFLCGLVLTVPATLLASIFAIGSKEFEVLDISKYDRAKKFEIIKRLIKNGVQENE